MVHITSLIPGQRTSQPVGQRRVTWSPLGHRPLTHRTAAQRQAEIQRARLTIEKELRELEKAAAKQRHRPFAF